MQDTLRSLLQPRFLLIAMGAIGIVGLLVILISAAQPTAKPWEEAAAPLLTGEVEAFEPTELPRGAPEELVARADGEQAYLPDLVGGGRVTLVNLWASWCAPCLEELPSLLELSERTGARLVPIAQERRSDAQEQALARAGVTGELPVLTDDDLSLSRVLGGANTALPLTVIYDARGQEVGRLLGAADWSSPEAVRLVTAIQAGELAG